MTPNMLGDTGILLAGVTEEPGKGGKEALSTSSATSTITQRHTSKTTTPANQEEDEYAWRIVWRNVLGMVYLHVGGLYGVYLVFTAASIWTFVWGVAIGWGAAIGVTAGAHRLWAHRTYKATWQLRLFLMLLQTICFQNHVYEWVRDHRVHHKYTDTDADPHNSKRGFFFSHVGWLLVRKHKDVKAKGSTVDMSDLKEDGIVMKKYEGVAIGWGAAIGVTAGAHRLWAHRTYKATWQLRLFLMLLQTICFQNHVYEWVRDHRVHHKYTDTDADPHNSKRGFFFSHVGWLLVRKHKDVKAKGNTVDMSDLKEDGIVMKKYEGVAIGWGAAIGVTAGAHRLWAHRTYKATWQLRLFLMLLQTICFQNHVYEWVRDHRVHHKYTDTDADPHNSKRGFFFSHVGWLLVRKHKDVKAKGSTVDMSDLKEDGIVMFQKKTYFVLMPLMCFVFPTLVPWYFWGENWWTAWYICGIFRYVLSLHLTWLVNSAAHIYGYRPYDNTISPTENKTVSLLAVGEGWHNYHHVFPWDYKAAELPTYGRNWTLGFLNQMARLGWAYDLKTVPARLVAARAARTGDGSHHAAREQQFWGWGDQDMKEEDRKFCEILYRRTE